MSAAGHATSRWLTETDRARWTTTTIGLAPVLFWLMSILVAATWPRLYLAVEREDGLLENLQALLLLGCVLIAAAAAWWLLRGRMILWSAIYALGAIAFLWMLGEEVSWGQRIFGWSTPAWMEENLQGESNLHNLPGVMSGMNRVLFYLLPIVSAASLVVWLRRPEAAEEWRACLWLPQPITISYWLTTWSYFWLREFHAWYLNTEEVHHSSIVNNLQESFEIVFYAGLLVSVAMAATHANAAAAASKRS